MPYHLNAGVSNLKSSLSHCIIEQGLLCMSVLDTKSVTTAW